MVIDIYAKSVQLLERVANSVHDRDPKNPNLLTFSVSEIHIVEDWIKELLKELKEQKARKWRHQRAFLYPQLNKEVQYENNNKVTIT